MNKTGGRSNTEFSNLDLVKCRNQKLTVDGIGNKNKNARLSSGN